MRPHESGRETPEPTVYISKKFSERASEWDTHKQECYSIYYCVKQLSYLLRGKYFEVETDHRNLQWMEKSEDPVIIRIRAYLQLYVNMIRHISAAKNKIADHLSRADFVVNHLCFLLHKPNYTHYEAQSAHFDHKRPAHSFLTLHTATFQDDIENEQFF